jgi:glycine cleavage system aminomethyltransferase T
VQRRPGGGSEGHDLRRLNDIARTEQFAVTLDNVTEQVAPCWPPDHPRVQYGVLGVAGPLAGELVGRLAGQEGEWPFLEARQVGPGGGAHMAR